MQEYSGDSNSDGDVSDEVGPEVRRDGKEARFPGDEWTDDGKNRANVGQW